MRRDRWSGRPGAMHMSLYTDRVGVNGHRGLGVARASVKVRARRRVAAWEGVPQRQPAQHGGIPVGRRSPSRAALVASVREDPSATAGPRRVARVNPTRLRQRLVRRACDRQQPTALPA